MSIFESIRLRLGSLDALPILAVMGLISGLIAGGVIVLFRLFIESGVVLWHAGGEGVNDFENFPWWLRLSLPLVGGFLVGFVLHKVGKNYRQVGIGHVLERMSFHQGYLPWRNAVVQFLVGGMTLASGQSVGREGPGIHLGSAAGSWLGQRMKLPNNSIRVLVGCGAAAAISASFNTPLAGVIFAMEIVMMEYAVTSFIPLILSSVSAAILSRIVFGNNVAFTVPSLELVSLWEVPYFVLLGLIIGSIASLFIRATRQVSIISREWSAWLKCGTAGTVVGIIALAAPQVMGIGYDTVNAALHGNLALQVLAIAFVGKLLATIVCSGMSLPGGVIGPSMFIGAMIGGVVGSIGSLILPDYASEYAFYSMIGMAAMMSAVLQAPLAALMALLELTNNPNILLPGMICLVIANLVVSQLFKLPSIFQSQMQVRGLEMKINPLSQFLRSVGVAGLMERKIAVHSRTIKFEQAEEILENTPRWILIKEEDVPMSLMAANDLARYVLQKKELEKEAQAKAEELGGELPEFEKRDVDLLQIPADRQNIASVYLQGNLEEALDTMDRESVDAVYIFRTTAPLTDKIYGVLTREAIESHYSYKK
ncbi:chloride channel protein [Aliikangiella sp. G2MR2-5]|uniref:chloride channel protein n=1 Tax=Aliikangiella sp. G2MR2-5 TaxID=2788943 RepID=UPI0018A8D34B|nr:chloride channel protein [Aliikangiella sp. G2MR2-5]